MKLGEVIRKYRKEKQMTQEEMAGYLGVSAPAVNKWENGNSCPDITLLAPIARLLGIRTDTLLSYEDQLSDQEIRRILTEVGRLIKEDSFIAGFQWAVRQVQEYPNCESLILGIAQTLEGYMLMLQPEKEDAYQEKIEEFYCRVKDSPDTRMMQEARMALAQHYLLREKTEQAQEMLDQIESFHMTAQKNRMQALLYKKQGKNDKAYELYERLLFAGGSDILWALQGLSALAVDENDRDKAWELVTKQEKLARLLELGEWMESSPGLGLSIESRDTEKCLDILERIIPKAEHIDTFRNTDLYRHIKFNASDPSNIIFMLRRSFENDESIDFLRREPRFIELMERLDRMEERMTKK